MCTTWKAVKVLEKLVDPKYVRVLDLLKTFSKRIHETVIRKHRILSPNSDSRPIFSLKILWFSFRFFAWHSRERKRLFDKRTAQRHRQKINKIDIDQRNLAPFRKLYQGNWIFGTWCKVNQLVRVAGGFVHSIWYSSFCVSGSEKILQMFFV